MHRALEATSYAEWQREALRRSALAASGDSRRGVWVAGLAVGAMLLCALSLVFVPGGLGRFFSGLDALQPFVEQTRRLPTGEVSSERLSTLAHPLWLVLARFTGDLAVVALVLSGLSAVVSLFLVYQLCHGMCEPARADEQACYALLGLALSPTFFFAAAGGGTELPHLALVLLALLCAQRALISESPAIPMSLSGLFFGLSLLIRPISLLVPLAMLLWLGIARPLSREGGGTLRPALWFAAAFAVGAASALLVHLIYHTTPISWGPAELAMLGSRLLADPPRIVAGAAASLFHYAAADDIERFGGVGGSWQAGDWLSLPGAIIALAPSILKLIGLAGLGTLLWVGRFEATIDRSRLPLVLLAVFLVGGGLGLVEERSLLVFAALLAVFAFAGLPNLVPGPLSGMIGLSMMGFLVFYQISGSHAARQSAPYRASDRVAVALREAGATPHQVISANWSFYDTRSPWRERYLHIPLYVDSPESLVREMRRQGARYLVFDRNAGASSWPKLAALVESDRSQWGLRPIGPALTTAESPPNTVAIYKLE